MIYAGFEKRLLANLIDVLVLLPLTIVLIDRPEILPCS
jgi:hypothetical protein